MNTTEIDEFESAESKLRAVCESIISPVLSEESSVRCLFWGKIDPQKIFPALDQER